MRRVLAFAASAGSLLILAAPAMAQRSQMPPAERATFLSRSAQESGDVSEVEFEPEESESPYDEPIETDRHDFTQATRTVGRGVLQLEYGVLFTKKETESERETTYSAPELQLRYGLTDRIEMQVRGNYGWKFIEQEDDLVGWNDLLIDFKVETTDQKCWIPESAVEWRFTAPTGGDSFTTGRVEWGFDYIYAWEFGEYFQLAASTGGSSNALAEFSLFDPETDRNDHFLEWTQSVALGAKMTRRSTAYFEWFGLWSHGRDEEFNLQFLNLGIDYLVTNNLLFDVRLGWGLNDQSDDVFAGVGGGFRF